MARFEMAVYEEEKTNTPQTPRFADEKKNDTLFVRAFGVVLIFVGFMLACDFKPAVFFLVLELLTNAMLVLLIAISIIIGVRLLLFGKFK